MSSVLAIDFGNENLVISAPRKGGIDIINKSSQRLIPSMIAFSDIRRYAGINAQHQQSMNIKSTLTDLKKLIGVKFNTKEREIIEKKIPFKLIKLDDDYIGVEVKYLKNSRIFRIEQCVSILLANAFQIANSQDIHATDCVLIVPPWWDEVQRKSILTSAKISGFSVLKLLNSTTAAAISYSMYQRKKLPSTPSEAVPVVFIDFGDSSFSVSISMLYQGSVEVKSFAFDNNLGGKNFTEILIDMLLEKTKEKYKIDPSSNHRAMLRFTKTAEKVKKNLSINRAIKFDIQNFMNGIDISFVVNREEFEERCAELVKKIEVPIFRALELANVKKEDVFAIELHGGASRVKAVKDKIREIFGKDFTQSLNPDEVFSIGGGFQAAILSSQYKVDLAVKDVSPFQINIEYEDDQNVKKTTPLFQQFTSLPSTKTVPIEVKKNCQIIISNEQSGNIGQISIETNKDEVIPINISVTLSSDGIIQTVEAAPVTDCDVTVSCSFKSCFEFSKDDITNFQNEEKMMQSRDKHEEEIDKARDNLRDYIFTMYNYLMCEFPGFDPSKKIEYLQKIMTVQDWFEENEFTRLPLEEYVKQIEILKEFGEPAIARKNAHFEIPNKLNEFIECASNERKKLDNKDEKFSHITDEERDEIRNEIDGYIKWIKNKIGEIEKMPQYVDIPFKVSEAKEKLNDIENKVIRVFMKPKNDC